MIKLYRANIANILLIEKSRHRNMKRGIQMVKQGIYEQIINHKLKTKLALLN